MGTLMRPFPLVLLHRSSPKGFSPLLKHVFLPPFHSSCFFFFLIFVYFFVYLFLFYFALLSCLLHTHMAAPNLHPPIFPPFFPIFIHPLTVRHTPPRHELLLYSTVFGKPWDHHFLCRYTTSQKEKPSTHWKDPADCTKTHFISFGEPVLWLVGV